MFPIRNFCVVFALLGFHAFAAAKDAATTAKELAPLVTETTFAVAHIDLDAIDVEKIFENVVAGLDETVAVFGFDEKSVKRISAELKKVLLRAERKIKGHLAVLTKKTNVGDAWFLMQFDDVRETDDGLSWTSTHYLAFPTANRTEEQRDALRKTLLAAEDEEDEEDEKPTPFFTFIEHAGFDVAMYHVTTLSDDSEEHAPLTEETARQLLQKPNPDAEKHLKAAFSLHPESPVRIVCFLTDKASAFSKVVLSKGDIRRNSPLPEETASKILALTDRFSEKGSWMCMTLDLEQMSFETVLQTKSESDAKDLLDASKEMCDAMGKYAEHGFQSSMEKSPLKVFGPFLGEMARGFYRTMIPVAEGDRLVLRMEEKRYGNAIAAFYAIAANITLPEPE